jgi:hypothetical protein
VLEGQEEEKEEEKAILSLSKTTINNEDQNQIKKKENEDRTTKGNWEGEKDSRRDGSLAEVGPSDSEGREQADSWYTNRTELL